MAGKKSRKKVAKKTLASLITVPKTMQVKYLQAKVEKGASSTCLISTPKSAKTRAAAVLFEFLHREGEFDSYAERTGETQEGSRINFRPKTNSSRQ